MHTDKTFINTLADKVMAKLYLKKDHAIKESKIDKTIVDVLFDNNVEMQTTDKDGKFIFGDYSEALKEAVCNLLKTENFEITSLAKENAIHENRRRETKQTKFF